MKRCRKCGLDLPLSAFGKDRCRREGIRSCCKVCVATAQRAWYRANWETAAERKKRWEQANPERRYAINLRWRRKQRALAIASRSL